MALTAPLPRTSAASIRTTPRSQPHNMSINNTKSSASNNSASSITRSNADRSLNNSENASGIRHNSAQHEHDRADDGCDE
eukprot:4939345-Alexandrium_andersonii.AAC.1